MEFAEEEKNSVGASSTGVTEMESDGEENFSTDAELRNSQI
jgi:hypothetical protein